jgi:mRNA-degrading endonuclease RelE of RelBE toxin-antitoxin system
MNWVLLITKPAKKNLEGLPSRDHARILVAFQAMQHYPFSGDIKRLNPSGWRRRLGSYRVFYDLFIADHQIVVTAIKRRTSTTYQAGLTMLF